MADKYDEAIAAIGDNLNAIRDAWASPHLYPGGCLFQFAGPWDTTKTPVYGCLTQIRSDLDAIAVTDELTENIRDDERIPDNYMDILPEHLPVFAEWQRKIDAMGVR